MTYSKLISHVTVYSCYIFSTCRSYKKYYTFSNFPLFLSNHQIQKYILHMRTYFVYIFQICNFSMKTHCMVPREHLLPIVWNDVKKTYITCMYTDWYTGIPYVKQGFSMCTVNNCELQLLCKLVQFYTARPSRIMITVWCESWTSASETNLLSSSLWASANYTRA